MGTILTVSGVSTIEDAATMMLADSRLRPASTRTYKYAIDAFIRFLHELNGNDHAVTIASLDVNVLADYNRWLKGRYAARTVKTYLAGAAQLTRWLDVHDLLSDVVFYDRMARRIDGARGRPHEGYKKKQVDPNIMSILSFLINKPMPSSKRDRLILLRDRALVAFLYDTATRVSEALSLTREDVADGWAESVELRQTKGGVPRPIFISADTRGLIRNYVNLRSDSIKAFLFVSHGRNRNTVLTAAHVWHIVRGLAKELGLLENTSPHSFRHKRAQDLFDEGMPLDWISALLGHVSPDTTRQVYAWKTDANRLAGMVQEYGKSPLQASRE